MDSVSVRVCCPMSLGCVQVEERYCPSIQCPATIATTAANAIHQPCMSTISNHSFATSIFVFSGEEQGAGWYHDADPSAAITTWLITVGVPVPLVAVTGAVFGIWSRWHHSMGRFRRICCPGWLSGRRRSKLNIQLRPPPPPPPSPPTLVLTSPVDATNTTATSRASESSTTFLSVFEWVPAVSLTLAQPPCLLFVAMQYLCYSYTSPSSTKTTVTPPPTSTHVPRRLTTFRPFFSLNVLVTPINFFIAVTKTSTHSKN